MDIGDILFRGLLLSLIVPLLVCVIKMVSSMHKSEIQDKKAQKVRNTEEDIRGLIDLIDEFISHTIHINDNCFVDSDYDRSWNKASITDIYHNIEKSFRDICQSNIPHYSCLNANSCTDINNFEKILISKQNQTLDKFHEIYSAMHEYYKIETRIRAGLRKISTVNSKLENKDLYLEDIEPSGENINGVLQENDDIITGHNAFLQDRSLLAEQINNSVKELRSYTVELLAAFIDFKANYTNPKVTLCGELPCKERKVYSLEKLI